ncbi:MAG: hypothetical protein ACE5F3_02610 [Mariprofundaceae bacterium]
MPYSATSATPLSIARHPLQCILHEAMSAQPECCCGLFACENGTVFATASIINRARRLKDDCDMDIQDIRTQLHRWRQQGVHFCGIYHASSAGRIPNVAFMEKLEHTVKKAAPEETEHDIVHLLLALDTEGRLEVHAFYCRQGTAIEITLALEDDSALYPDLANG